MIRSASEVLRNLETRIARLEKQAIKDPDVSLAEFVDGLRAMLGRDIKVETQLEMTESHGKTYTIFINPFVNEESTLFFMARERRRGYMPTPELKKKVSLVTRAFNKAIKMNKDNIVVIGLDGQLNAPRVSKDYDGQPFYDETSGPVDYRWELFVYNDY